MFDRIGRVLFVLALGTGCLSCNNQGSSTSSSSDPSSNIQTYKSSIAAIAQSPSSLRLVKLDGVTPIDGTENDILVCTKSFEYCTQTCISIYRPEFVRWSVFKTDYLTGGKCVAVAMAYPDGTTIPRMAYWQGTYVYNAPPSVVGKCSIDVVHPSFDGKAYFDFVRVPAGQVSPAPGGARTYYLHSWFDMAENPVKSFMPRTFNAPSMWTYSDSSVAVEEITPILVNGFSCIKQSEISNAF